MILLGDWRKPVQGHITNWTNAEKVGITVGLEGLMQAGFIVNSDNESISYRRKDEALALEGSIARGKILEFLYRSQKTWTRVRTIREAALFEDNTRDTAINQLLDLKFFSMQPTSVTGDEYEFRLTAEGRRHYEEKVLPAHNQVFIIAPCSDANKYGVIRDAYKEVAENEFGYETKFQESSTTKEITIRDDILANLRFCKFVIADITGRGWINTKDAAGKDVEEFERFNYNCIYELGFAHALNNKKLVCFVSKEKGYKSGELKMPFDFAAVQFDDWEIEKVDEFKEKLRKRLRDIKEHFQREYWPEK